MMKPKDAFIQATKARAKAYYFLYEELLQELGSEKADKIFSGAIYKLGLDKAQTFCQESFSSAKVLAEEFVKEPLGRDVFGQHVLFASSEKAIIEMKNCPLVEAWKEMNLPKEKIKKLCDLAHCIDFGTIEGKGQTLVFSERIADGDKCCLLEINTKGLL